MAAEAQPSLAEMSRQEFQPAKSVTSSTPENSQNRRFGRSLARVGFTSIALVASVSLLGEGEALAAPPEIEAGCFPDHTAGVEVSIPAPQVDSPVSWVVTMDGERYPGGYAGDFPAGGRNYTTTIRTHTRRFSSGNMDFSYSNDPSSDRHVAFSALDCDKPAAAPTTTEAPAPPPTSPNTVAAPATTVVHSPETAPRPAETTIPKQVSEAPKPSVAPPKGPTDQPGQQESTTITTAPTEVNTTDMSATTTEAQTTTSASKKKNVLAASKAAGPEQDNQHDSSKGPAIVLGFLVLAAVGVFGSNRMRLSHHRSAHK